MAAIPTRPTGPSSNAPRSAGAGSPRCSGPTGWQLSVVVALIVASSTVALATPFLVRLVIDEALPRQDVRLLVLAVGGMLAVTVVTAVLGVVQTWLSTTVGQRVMHGLRTAVFTPPAAPVARLLHPHQGR